MYWAAAAFAAASATICSSSNSPASSKPKPPKGPEAPVGLGSGGVWGCCSLGGAGNDAACCRLFEAPASEPSGTSGTSEEATPRPEPALPVRTSSLPLNGGPLESPPSAADSPSGAGGGAAAASAAAPPFLVCFLAAAFLAVAARALVASLAASTREGRREHSRGRPPPLGPLAGVEGAGATTHVWKEPGARLAASTQPPGPTGTDCHASGSRSSVTHTRPVARPGRATMRAGGFLSTADASSTAQSTTRVSPGSAHHCLEFTVQLSSRRRFLWSQARTVTTSSVLPSTTGAPPVRLGSLPCCHAVASLAVRARSKTCKKPCTGSPPGWPRLTTTPSSLTDATAALNLRPAASPPGSHRLAAHDANGYTPVSASGPGSSAAAARARAFLALASARSAATWLETAPFSWPPPPPAPLCLAAAATASASRARRSTTAWACGHHPDSCPAEAAAAAEGSSWASHWSAVGHATTSHSTVPPTASPGLAAAAAAASAFLPHWPPASAAAAASAAVHAYTTLPTPARTSAPAPMAHGSTTV
mmetsp:Transcript_37487/g.83830  ORF Transcript_37487/g.83830 Transcript_37487/m.83830 type:complete len:535 (+) Transcript_37487:1363-2967(+)